MPTIFNTGTVPIPSNTGTVSIIFNTGTVSKKFMPCPGLHRPGRGLPGGAGGPPGAVGGCAVRPGWLPGGWTGADPEVAGVMGAFTSLAIIIATARLIWYQRHGLYGAVFPLDR